MTTGTLVHGCSAYRQISHAIEKVTCGDWNRNSLSEQSHRFNISMQNFCTFREISIYPCTSHKSLELAALHQVLPATAAHCYTRVLLKLATLQIGFTVFFLSHFLAFEYCFKWFWLLFANARRFSSNSVFNTNLCLQCNTLIIKWFRYVQISL